MSIPYLLFSSNGLASEISNWINTLPSLRPIISSGQGYPIIPESINETGVRMVQVLMACIKSSGPGVYQGPRAAMTHEKYCYVADGMSAVTEAIAALKQFYAGTGYVPSSLDVKFDFRADPPNDGVYHVKVTRSEDLSSARSVVYADADHKYSIAQVDAVLKKGAVVPGRFEHKLLICWLRAATTADAFPTTVRNYGEYIPLGDEPLSPVDRTKVRAKVLGQTVSFDAVVVYPGVASDDAPKVIRTAKAALH